MANKYSVYHQIQPGQVVKVIELGDLITTDNHFKAGNCYLIVSVDSFNISLVDETGHRNGWTFGRMSNPPVLQIIEHSNNSTT